MVFINEKENKRTIDYDRNACIRPVSGKYAGKSSADLVPHYFELSWNESIIPFAAYYHQQKVNDDAWDIEWIVFQTSIPDHLKDKKAEVKHLIFEALDTYGVYYGKSRVRNTEIKVIPYLKAF